MLEERFGKKHPALEHYKEPHPSQAWLVDTFFRLHRRRPYGEAGPKPIPYTDMVIMFDDILTLPPKLRSLYFRTIEETDASVLSFLYKEQAAKMEELDKSRGRRKIHGQ